MKKYINYAILYFILGGIGGVFFREFTRWHGFVGETKLSVLHTHSLTLGMIFFLATALFVHVKPSLRQNGKFRLFGCLYNAGLLLMIATLTARGILQVMAVELGRMPNAIVGGLAGLSHILLTVGLVLFFIALHQEFKD